MPDILRGDCAYCSEPLGYKRGSRGIRARKGYIRFCSEECKKKWVQLNREDKEPEPFIGEKIAEGFRMRYGSEE